jgi:hypothetical protein
MQLSLFDSTLPVVSAPRPCRCGGLMATLSSSRGPHAGELVCADCGRHIKWAGHVFVAELRGSAGFVTGISSFKAGTRP